MVNHPLNNMGYQGLRQMIMSVLAKLDIYLDMKIEEEKRKREKEK